MYRILIVDDEKTERSCIRFLVQDLQFPLEIKEASDGADALEILKTYHADILFTDVQMPLMDGLELIRQATGLLPRLKLIIFSGYADFEYARTAITLGVENYILKPVVPKELSKTLTKLIKQLDEEQDSLQQMDRQKSFLLQYALQLSISGNFDEEKADPYILGQIPLFKRMVLLDFNNSFLENNYSAFYETLKAKLHLDMESLNPSPSQALLFLRTAVADSLSFGHTLLSFIHSCFQTDCYISISEPLDTFSTLKDAFNQVEQQMEQRFWAPSEQIFLSLDPVAAPADTQSFDDNRQLSLIKRALSAKDRDSLIQNLELLFQKYRLPSNQSQIYVKFIFSNLMTTLYSALPKAKIKTMDSLDTMVAQMYLQKDISEIIHTIQNLAEQIIEGFSSGNETLRKELLTVENYIHENYSKEISVEMLASIVYLTPDYLSRLFKKAFGKSLSQYIRQYRMEKASSLLLETNKKVIQIGMEVGYSNYSYFCQSFREYFGISPEKYRQEKML